MAQELATAAASASVNDAIATIPAGGGSGAYAITPRILRVLQLTPFDDVQQLHLVIDKFRLLQKQLLLEMLLKLQTTGNLVHVIGFFHTKSLDLTHDLEQYCHDLLKFHNYSTHLKAEARAYERMLLLYGFFGVANDRAIRIKPSALAL